MTNRDENRIEPSIAYFCGVDEDQLITPSTTSIDEAQLDLHIKQRIDDNWELVVKLFSLSQWLGTHHRCGDCTVPDCCESCYSGDTEFDVTNDISDTVVQLFGNYEEKKDIVFDHRTVK